MVKLPVHSLACVRHHTRGSQVRPLSFLCRSIERVLRFIHLLTLLSALVSNYKSLVCTKTPSVPMLAQGALAVFLLAYSAQVCGHGFVEKVIYNGEETLLYNPWEDQYNDFREPSTTAH